MNAAQIRQSFLDFFAEHGHTVVPSAPVFPQGDATLMFTNAGMNQFKPYFLGQASPKQTRVTDSQKCIRVSGKHNDLEEVGHDTYHHTLFEMLGNWSFGDYYKKEAIAWAWELVTKRWNLPKDRLYATVFAGDEKKGLGPDLEAEQYWQEVTDIDHTHIKRCGAKDNFWMMGEVGPCGPCSEIHIDLTPDKSGGDLVNGDSPLVMELWNLVFIGFNAEPNGTLSKLPACHIDTGAGLDRVAAVIECTKGCSDFTAEISNYDTSLFRPLIAKLEEISGRKYTSGMSQDEDSISFRVCADHLRMIAFAVADGGLPSNEGRGYVMRRILRRAARYGRKLGLLTPFLHKLIPTLIQIMGEAYPELVREQEKIQRIIKGEETSFNQTLDRGIVLFEEEAGKIAPSGTFPGEVAFKLYDTFGFPYDLTEVMAKERGFNVDEEGFKQCMLEQKTRARNARVKTQELAEDETFQHEATVFVGYEELQCQTKVAAVLGHGTNRAIILEKTPFYAEMGGEVGDTGTITVNGQVIPVTDTKKREGTVLHMIDPNFEFSVNSGDEAVAAVDVERRLQIQRHHTATHILHWALREVLGSEVHQQGSLVAPDRLRFDFTCSEAVGRERLATIENMINQKILENTGVSWFEIPMKDKPDHVIAFFGDKYGDTVRILNVGGKDCDNGNPNYDGFSIELCGGCHTKRTGDIGLFKFLSEGAIASGVRRVEAVVGTAARTYMLEELAKLDEAALRLHATSANILERLDSIVENQKKLEKELEKIKQQAASSRVDDILKDAETINGTPFIHAVFEGSTPAELRQIADGMRNKFKGVAVLAGTSEDKASLLVTVTEDFVKKGLHAGKMVKALAQEIGGGGGGKPDLAQAGGKNCTNLAQVLANAANMLKA